MRTENDLRQAIDQLAEDAAYIIAFRDLRAAQPSSPRRPRVVRVLVPAVAALVVAAVAVVAVVVFGGRSGSGRIQTAGPRATPLTWRFAVRDVPGYRIVRDGIAQYSFPAADAGERAGISSTGSRVTGSIDFDTVPGQLVGTGRPTVVDGIRYYFRPGRHVSRQGGLTPGQYAHPWVAAGQDAHGPQLAWHYPDGTQVVVTGSFGFHPSTYDYDNAAARRVMMRIALAVQRGRDDPTTMPFRLASAPAGLAPVALDTVPAAQQDADPLYGRQPLSACLKYATTRHPSPLTPTESLLIVCRVQVLGSRATSLADIAFAPDVIARSYVRRLADGTLLAVGVPAGRAHLFTPAQLKAIAEHADVSPSLAKPRTWLGVN